MGLRPTQGDEKRLSRPRSLFHGSAILPFVISTEAQRRDLCVDAHSWEYFSTKRNGAERPALSRFG